ncbi:carboxyl-terminal PDZ ligand of neuronal nitric oxide synthase protein [Bicyclus anynana]|uniref:Carboxyl-terminal PDZ ligand of neuronal nitric oxide synthase protein n=1 Tax=Bicyclus anynana TaxID=110368 RepID=A0ABM3M526_BICAN|nr:carboxyl-terminal PDZ ligand of neuronal nitric oxide synthase protein [Bicyclus anynana]
MFKRKVGKVHQVRHYRIILKPKAWRRIPMKILKWGRKMTSTKHYSLVTHDDYDARIPLHADGAFEYGITFRAKYIGTMEIDRPTSRVEIVAAMRRVRYEFKACGIKKRPVVVTVSLDGVTVTTYHKRPFFFSRKKKNLEGVELMHHPIYRIFYVSHDSADLKIFSYIARDGATNEFKCSVFKSKQKTQAMKIVRTVGQAFEVSYRMQVNSSDEPVASTSSAPDEVVTVEYVREVPAPRESASESGASGSGGASTSKAADEPKPSKGAQHIDPLPPPPRKEGKRAQVPKPVQVPTINLPDLPDPPNTEPSLPEGEATPLTAQHQLQLMQEQLEQQEQHTRAAFAQLVLFRDQLAAEKAARCEAQARTHQLLVHNKELLEHIAALVAHLREKEKGNHRPISAQTLTLLPQMQAGGNEPMKTDNSPTCNGNCQPMNNDELISFVVEKIENEQMNQNIENNNVTPSTSGISSNATKKQNDPTPPALGKMNNDEYHNYVISKFQDLSLKNAVKSPKAKAAEAESGENKYFFQNTLAFPNIPPLVNHYSESDLANILKKQLGDISSSSDEFGDLAKVMSTGHSDNSLYSTSSTSKDSSDISTSDEILPYIMPLSHNGTLTATGEDGRVRVIVPVSPSPSTSGIAGSSADVKPAPAPKSATLKVPGSEAPAAPITRSTSEKVPNRSEMMDTLRSQWTRHTTK